MKTYVLETIFSFGKHKGKTLAQIVDLDPSYIEWCIINLEHFYIYEEIFLLIKTVKPDFSISDHAKQKLNEKCKIIMESYEYQNDDDSDYYSGQSHREMQEATYDALTDGMDDDFDDWLDAGGDMDRLRDDLGF